MNNYILVLVKGNYFNLFLRKSFNNGIYLKSVKYLSDDRMTVLIKIEDYKKLKKINSNYKMRKIKSFGLLNLTKLIKKNIHLIIISLFGIGLLFFLSNIIVKVEVIHSDFEIRKIVKDELDNYGITRFSFKKNYNELQIIKEKIKENHKEKIEWIEIINEGMTYTIRVEERIITPFLNEKTNCHIVASKDAVILNVIGSSGERLVEVNSYVHKGDILISGDIVFNDEIKTSTCAKGTVYGEVWYQASIAVPLTITFKERSGNKRYNLKINDSKIFRSQYQEYEEKSEKFLDFWGINFYLTKEYEVKRKKKKMTTEEAALYGLEKLDESFNRKFNDGEFIMSKNVLKNEANDSTINLEVFVVVKEIISSTVTY